MISALLPILAPCFDLSCQVHVPDCLFGPGFLDAWKTIETPSEFNEIQIQRGARWP